MTSPIIIDENRYRLTLPDGNCAQLTRTQILIAAGMAKHPGWVWSQDQIIAMFHRRVDAVAQQTANTHIKRIREKVGKHLIITHRGLGFSWSEDYDTKVISREKRA